MATGKHTLDLIELEPKLSASSEHLMLENYRVRTVKLVLAAPKMRELQMKLCCRPASFQSVMVS